MQSSLALRERWLEFRFQRSYLAFRMFLSMENLPVHYVDSSTKLQALISELSSHEIAGLDTEFISEGHYEPALCLIQVSTESGIWNVDPLSIPTLDQFWSVLLEGDRELVTVAARQEIRFCAKGAGRAPARVFDLQIAAGLIGYGYPLSHTNLVLRTLGQKVHGGESFTDWHRRPLTPLQLKYAADDVRYLIEMRNRLVRRAEQMNRLPWVHDECQHLTQDVMQEQEKWRVSGSARLSRRQLAVLHEVWHWRDRVAQQMNIPAARALSDSMLVEVARRSPVSVEDLFAIRGMDKRLLRGAEQEIVKAVKTAQAIPEHSLPSNERRDDPQQVAVLAKLLSVAANGLAAEHEVDPALLATTADLQELVRWYLEQDGTPKPALLQGWRASIVAEPLLGFLQGDRCMRVGNVKRANPLVFDEWQKPPQH
jgi:ribonuclease D